MSTLDNLYNALTRRIQIANKDITRDIIEDWVGHDSDQARQIAFMSEALGELESGAYTPEEMVVDMLRLAHPDN